MNAYELNLDGLVGPTHNYAGLSYGNIASQQHGQGVSNPKAAAKQGLKKMYALHQQGFKQGILLPHERPAIKQLKQLGFSGSDSQILAKVAKEQPALLAAVCSASSMWTANAATVSPSADTLDGRIHFTAANLNAKLHRAIEHPTTSAMLHKIFKDERYFAHHPALPAMASFGDEGAANHTRFCSSYEQAGVELFVYGKEALNKNALAPQKFPARQSLEASQAIARFHGLTQQHCVFAQQHPDTIDAGVFHNDVIAVGNRNLLFYHQQAFVHTNSVLQQLDDKLVGERLLPICVPSEKVTLTDAVQSYLFNSQLLSMPDGSMSLVVPSQCETNTAVANYLAELTASSNNPINSLQSFDLKQSMNNGGGPACLRLRVVVNEAELTAMHQGVLLTDELYHQLTGWVDKHYRDRLSQTDLADPSLLNECRTALDELCQITQMGTLYDFQQE